jgi:putative transposase
MARLPRLTLPGHVHHVIQRGHPHAPIVVDDLDRQRLLDLWHEHAQRCQVAIHAYVLLDHQFHLLATPETDTGLALMMQSVGRSYVRHFNVRHHRTGGLWEGRYRSNLIESERYLLPCMVHLDQLPVHTGLVAQGADHRWSSHRHHIGLASDKLVRPHALYWALGNTPFDREAAYARLVEAGLDAATTQALNESALKGWALGSEKFMLNLQLMSPRRPQPGRAGRPKRTSPSSSVPN